MIVEPLTLDQANALVTALHRHHKPVQGHRFSLAAKDSSGRLCGAAIIGRPSARMSEQYLLAEVTRLVTDGTKNTCSFLYAAAARVAQEMGFHEIQTFILASESGVSLSAAGWEYAGDSDGGSWSRPSRKRLDSNPTEPKKRYRKVLRNAKHRISRNSDAPTS